MGHEEVQQLQEFLLDFVCKANGSTVSANSLPTASATDLGDREELALALLFLTPVRGQCCDHCSYQTTDRPEGG